MSKQYNNLHQTIETTLIYNIKVTRNVKINYIKQQINNKEINNIKNTKKIYAMSKKSPKSVPGLTNMPKNAKHASLPVTFLLMHGIGQTLSSILTPNGA